MEIPNGKYKGKAKTSAPTLIDSTKNNTPGVTVEMVLLDPAMNGATLPWTGWLSDAAFERTVESLRHMGWTGADVDQITGLDTNEVELVIEAEEYDGNVFPRIKFVNKPGAISMGVPMTPERARTFAASLKDRIRALDAAGGRKPAARTSRPPPPSGQHQGGAMAPEPPPLSDADIPF